MKRTNGSKTMAMVLALFAVLVMMVTPAMALEDKIIRDIERADTSSDLSELAEDITSDAANQEATDFEESMQVATETSTYLLYILVKQNALIMDMYLEAQEPVEEE